MVWYVYILLCDEKTFYVGISNNIVNRINTHKNKQSFFTKKFSHHRLVYSESYPTEHEAAIREKQLKGWGKAKKQLLIQGKLGLNTCTEFVEELLSRRDPL
jgi:putative endonuclease